MQQRVTHHTKMTVVNKVIKVKANAHILCKISSAVL